ncbi:MAG TPA: RtcB family protein [Actinomycetota bacterium]|jgi:tRNA-splicing ligase RtcB|nr:RtcB family protein [Actinomycetota bacterium]
MPNEIAPNVLSWASELDELTTEQAARTARLPILAGHLALMPDAHYGMGATIGSVIPTETAVIPSAVGVDIGCGMAARRLDLRVDQLPDAGLDGWVDRMRRDVPAGLGNWHGAPSDEALAWMNDNPPPPTLRRPGRAAEQLGTLGSGNHFVELASDEEDRVWILLHSGSRGGGNKLATLHTGVARRLHEGLGTELEDPELAWLQLGSDEFDAYIRDLGWAQAYARENRRQLLAATHRTLERTLACEIADLDEVNCHHNYTELEEHDGRWLWITRKGAIHAGVGARGLIPGSMGQRSYLVVGLGNEASYQSCSHGAGRRMSRNQARKTLSVETLEHQMAGRAWQASDAQALLDEAPDAYKPIDVVMRDQADLVRIEHALTALANYKGVERIRRR